MLSRRTIAVALCAMMLLSCVVVITSADARRTSDWSIPTLLEGGEGYDAKECKMAMNSAGDAVAAWRSYDGDYWVINATTYTGGSWGVVTTLSAGLGNCWNPAVAIDDAGNAVVIYAQFDGSRYDAKAASLTGGEWGSPYELDSDLMSIPTPQVAMNGTGYAVVVYDANHDGTSDIYASIYEDGGWGESRLINDGIHSAGSAQVDMNSNGSAMAVWLEAWNDVNVVRAVALDDGQWGNPDMLSIIGGGACANPDVALSAAGVPFVVWQQEDGGKYVINGTVRFDGTWFVPGTLSEDGVSSTSPQVVMNDKGDIGVVWTVDNGSTHLVTTARTLYDGTWSTEEILSNDDYTSEMPQISIDTYGEIIVLWYETGGSYDHLYSRSFTNGAWANTQDVSVSESIFAPQLAMNDDGGAIAVWYEQNGESAPFTVYSSTYTPKNMPTVSITSPAEDDVVTSGSVEVQWTGANVDHYTISVDGAEAVDVDQDLMDTIDLEDGEHVVNVTAFDVRGRSSYAEVSFIVDTAAPAVNVTVPAIGAWYNTSSLNVTWTVSDAGSGILNTSVSVDGAAFADVDHDYFVIADLEDGHHTVAVRAYDHAGHFRTVTKDFNIQTALPVLTISPSDGSLLSSRDVTVSWSGVSDSTVGRYWLSVDGGAFVDHHNATSFLVTGLADGEHNVTLKAEDYAGNWNSTYVEFEIDATAPVVTITAPVDGVHTVAREATVEWTAYEAGSGLDRTEYSVDGGAFIVTTDLSLELTDLADGEHTVTVRAVDMAGNVGEATVHIVVDTAAPTAVIEPSGDDASVNAAIIVTFSEAMNTSAVTITVGGVDGTIAWNDNVATFTPSRALSYDTAYSVAVAGKDLAGNEMSASSSFTTMKNAGSLSGVIRSADGTALDNATVTLSNGMTATTDVNGHFEFTGVPSGTYTMTVTKDGYVTMTQQVTVTAGQSSSLATMSMASSAASGGDSGWMLGIVGVVVVAMLAVGFIVYRYKKK
ncbi:MAG: carboxypeptidase regulatory-like domain-containing protein [Methanomassiliicoccus sp.]|nr:carboxypeptidase regulatory-like domain-containing protein [Methanomassiliicoccus sp.]